MRGVELIDRWRALCEAATADAAQPVDPSDFAFRADPVGADLLGRYAEPHRRHHDTRHLVEVLDAIDLLAADPRSVSPSPGDRSAGDPPAARLRNPAVVRLAAWFHDAVYDVLRADNEEASAVLAEQALSAVGLPPNTTAEVARLVRLTAQHRPAPNDLDGAVLCDADLSVLGATPARYAEYAAGIRREYAAMDDAAFGHGRGRVLQRLLARDPLFGTPAGRSRWQQAARANLAAELRALSEGRPVRYGGEPPAT